MIRLWLTPGFALIIGLVCCLGRDHPAQQYSDHALYLSPGNQLQSLRVCKGQRIADATADYLLSLGIHDDKFALYPTEYSSLMTRLCFQTYPNQDEEQRECEVTMPSTFFSDDTKFTTVHFEDSAAGRVSVPVYLRQGYSANELTVCLCETFGCEVAAQTAISQYLASVMSAF
jgi:hypothetical protein